MASMQKPDYWTRSNNKTEIDYPIPSPQDLRTQAEAAVLAQNTTRLFRIECSVDLIEGMVTEVNKKLELILDTMTKPAQQSAPEVSVETKSEEPKSNEPKRMLGPSAQMQIVRYIEQQPGGTAVFKKLASAGFVSARIRTKPPGCPPSHRYTHTVIIRNSASGLPKFEPTIFGIDEAREVVAYLESLGVKVNSKALNRA